MRISQLPDVFIRISRRQPELLNCPGTG